MSQAAELKDKAAAKAESQLERGKDQATEALDDVAEALHEAGTALHDHDRDAFARFAEAAADQVEQFAQAIRQRSVGDLLDEAQRYARREPGLFIGGAFLLGIFGARFLKASEPRRYQDYGASYGRPQTAYGRPTGAYDRPGSFARPSVGSGTTGGTDWSREEPPSRVRHTPGGEMPNPTDTSGTPRTPASGPSTPGSPTTPR